MRKIIYMGLCVLGYLLFGLAVALYTGHFGNLIFVWNIFLAYLPLVFAGILTGYVGRGGKSRFFIAFFAILWLLFFPNAPYLVTDLIYFGNAEYFISDALTVTYTTSVLMWVKIIYIGSAVFFGPIMGLDSLYDMHRLVKSRKGRVPGTCFVAAVGVLSGFAIYIGRILRFNSWDVLQPFSLIDKFMENINRFSILFSLVFAAYVLGTYLIYLALIRGRERDKGDSL